jgi:hypothetical protein
MINSDNNEKIIIELNEKVDRIERLLSNEILNKCNKMSSHIDFIEQIYEYVKFPLFYISDKFKSLRLKQNVPIEHQCHQTETSDQC